MVVSKALRGTKIGGLLRLCSLESMVGRRCAATVYQEFIRRDSISSDEFSTASAIRPGVYCSLTIRRNLGRSGSVFGDPFLPAGLGENSHRCWKCLQDLDDTKWLDLFGTNVRGSGLKNIAKWESLHSLFLNNNPIGDEGMAHLKNLRSLTWLELQRTRISDEGLRYFSGLTKLNRLDLSFTSVSDAGLPHLRSLKSLSRLSLENTEVTKAGKQAQFAPKTA